MGSGVEVSAGTGTSGVRVGAGLGVIVLTIVAGGESTTSRSISVLLGTRSLRWARRTTVPTRLVLATKRGRATRFTFDRICWASS